MRTPSAAFALLIALAPLAAGVAQTEHELRTSPFVAGAISAGALGFTGGAASHGLVGVYGYAAFPRLILGVQGGVTLARRGPSDAAYGMATLGYRARAIRQSLVYPFVGVGAGVMDGPIDGRRRSAVFGAGVGVDRVRGDGHRGRLIGLRGGYLVRAGDIGERAIHLSFAIGAGGRRAQPEKPPIIIVATKGPGSAGRVDEEK